MADEEKKEIILEEKKIDLNKKALEVMKILAGVSKEDRGLISDVLEASEGVIEYLLDYPLLDPTGWKKIVILETAKMMLEAGKEEEKK